MASLIASLGSYPAYFKRLGEINRRGPAVLEDRHRLRGLDVEEVRGLADNGAQVVDARPLVDFAAGHLPGSLSNPLRSAFATWLGWLADPQRPVVFVRNPDQDPAEILGQATKIGFDDLAGELLGEVEAWAAHGLPVERIPLCEARDLDATTVLDIRQDSEFAAGYVPGAVHVELGELAARTDELPDGPLVVMCGHGERAMAGASLLARSGRRELSVLAGGPEDWAAATGLPLTVER